MGEEVKKLEEIEELIAPAEETLKGKIVRMVKGKVKDLIDINNIRNEELRRRFEKQADRDAIMIELDVSGMTVRRILPISLRPNARYFRLLKKYKRLKVGDEIDVSLTKSGRIQILYD